MVGPATPCDYRILVSRGARRPGAQLYAWTVPQPIPAFPLPLLPDDGEPVVDLGAILAALYDRARYDISLDYTKPPVPPLRGGLGPRRDCRAHGIVRRLSV